MSTHLLLRFQRVCHGLSRRPRHRWISTNQKDLMDQVFISMQPSDISEYNSIAPNEEVNSTHSNSRSMSGHMSPVSDSTSRPEKTTTSHYVTPHNSPIERDYDRMLIRQRAISSKSSRELFDLLQKAFQNSIVTGKSGNRHEGSLLDMKLAILILEQCERLMDMRLPWILLSQMRQLENIFARRIIGMDVYNAILGIIIYTPNRISNRCKDCWGFQTSDTGELEKNSFTEFGRSSACTSLVERTIDEAHRHKLKWNLDTHDLLLQYYLMSNQMLKTNWLLNRLHVYMHRLEKKASLSPSTITSTPGTFNFRSGSQESYPKARYIYTKYKKIIEEIQGKRRWELLNSSPLILAEKNSATISN